MGSKETATATATASSGGIGFAGLLTVLFVALKLIGIITWSWVWVLSPLWISAGIFVAVCLLAIVVYLVLKRAAR